MKNSCLLSLLYAYLLFVLTSTQHHAHIDDIFAGLTPLHTAVEHGQFNIVKVRRGEEEGEGEGGGGAGLRIENDGKSMERARGRGF